LQIQNVGNQNGIRRNRLSFLAFVGGLHLERFSKGGRRDHAGCQHDEIDALRDHGGAGEHIVGHHDQSPGAVLLDLGNRPADKKDAVLLESLIKEFVIAGSTNVLVEDINRQGRIGFFETAGLFERFHTTCGGAVGQMGGIARTGAENEGDTRDRLPG